VSIAVECNDSTLVVENVVYDNSSSEDKVITIMSLTDSWSYTVVAGTSGTQAVPAGFFGGARVTEEEGTITTIGSLRIGES